NKLEIGDEVIEIGEGEVHVTDYSRGHRSHLQPTHQRSVTVAHELVGYDPSIHPATMRFQTETVIGAILHRTIDTIFQNLDRTTEAEAPVVAKGLLALLRNVLFSDVAIAMATPAFAVARTRAIRQFVDEEIAHGRLTVDAVSAKFNVSRATLYRDFKEEGGVERFILSRRLEATLSTLAHGPAERGAVTRAAERYGFSSTSHLSREFRRHFGFSPSEVVGSGAPSLLTPDHGARGSAARPGQALEAFLNNL
ncbi:MAG: AraC family transcriptional regulator, partial [Pseudomonadota bacterium]